MSGSGKGMRLQKFLSRAGVASRRQAETLMAQGRVKVNGEAAVTPGIRVEPAQDVVEVDGRVVDLLAPRWIMLNKPRGVLTTRKDVRGRPTVYDLLPPEAGALRYVGRLDLDTEGLLLMTNEGETGHRLLHPSFEVPREYRVQLRSAPTKSGLARLEAGIELEDGPARAEHVRLLRKSGDGALLALVLREGRKREVRRLMEAIGHPVQRLRRVRFGPVKLGELPTGKWRELSRSEVLALRQAAETGRD